MSGSGKHILFIVPYPEGKAPSQRFRFEQFLPYLEESGYTWEIASFLGENSWAIFYKPGNTLLKAYLILKGYFKRILLLPRLSKFDHIYVHREFSPLGPPLLGWMISFVLKKSFIFDFDDAIWLPNHSDSNRLFKFLKPPSNALKLMKWSKINACGNSYLLQKAQTLNANNILIPTTIDTERVHNRINTHLSKPLVVGWTGSHSTIKYLEELYPVFEKLNEKFDYRLRVIADFPPSFELPNVDFIEWNPDSEIEDLLAIDIGLMPLPDDEWAVGKCGLKALQYMSLGIPPVLSAVGINAELIENGNQGYFCESLNDWELAISTLLSDESLIQKMGQQTRIIVEENFSTRSAYSKFILLFANK